MTNNNLIKRYGLLLLVVISYGLLAADTSKSRELKSLSIKELMNIPLEVDHSQYRIYQPSDNEIGDKTLQFGLIAPISMFPVYSAEIITAADLAANYINKHGGVNNKRLVILRADDHENTPVSARLAGELVQDYAAQALIGPATSDSVSDVLEKVAVPKGIPLITQAASAMKLSELGKNGLFWRMVANNEQQVELIAQHLHQKLGHKRVFVISGRDVYSKEITQGLTQYYKSLQDGWIDHMAISSLVYLDGMNLEDEIKAIQAKNASAIVITLPTAQMTAIIKKIRDHWQGPFPLLMAADTVKPKYLYDAKLGDITQCILTYVSSPTELAPELRDQIKTILNRDSAGFDAAYVYDAVIILAMATQLSNQFDIDFKQAVNTIAADGFPITHYDYSNIVNLYKKHKKFSYSGYSGRIHFNEQGDNLTANMKIYALASDTQNSKQCQVKN